MKKVNTIKKIDPILERMIEQSDASPKRKEVVNKLLTSDQFKKLKTGVKSLSKPGALNGAFKKAGWNESQRGTVLPTMIATAKDGVLKMTMMGASSVVNQEGANSDAGKKANKFLSHMKENFPAYTAKLLSPNTQQQMGTQTPSPIVAAESVLRENIRKRIKRILKGNK